MTHWMDAAMAEAEIAALADEWAAAERDGDFERLDALLAADFACVDARGRVLSREAWLDRLWSGRLRYRSFAWKADGIRVHGQSAVAVGRQVAVGTYAGERVDGRMRGTQVWVDGDGGWRLAALHLTALG
jgi:ketosteroid isomerase-like protein